MAQPYLTDLQAIAVAYASDRSTDGITCKHFFSGAAAYILGRIFVTLTLVGLAFKLPEALRNTLLEAGGQPLQYFPGAPIKRDYVVYPDPGELEPTRLAELISDSIEHVLAP